MDVGQVLDAAARWRPGGPPARKSVVGQIEQAADFAPAAADENGVRIGQVGPGLRGPAEHRHQIPHAEPLRVGPDQRMIFGVHFDGVDCAAGGDLRGLDGDRAAAGADIPHDARRAAGPFGPAPSRALPPGVSRPCLGLRLQERLVGVAEQPPADRFARAIGHVAACAPGSSRSAGRILRRRARCSSPCVTRSSGEPRFSQTYAEK